MGHVLQQMPAPSLQVARTCSTFPPSGKCVGLSKYPNATISEYGSISGKSAMMKEIYARGPISCGIDASPILKYTGGIATDQGSGVDHVISVVGWGNDPTEGQYWIVRNVSCPAFTLRPCAAPSCCQSQPPAFDLSCLQSWGEYWGEMGYVNVKFGALKIEEQCAWAVPKSFTEWSSTGDYSPGGSPNFPCYEDGSNC
jgi:cathepsin X